MPAAEEGKTAAEEGAADEENAAAPTPAPEAEDDKVSLLTDSADGNTMQGCRKLQIHVEWRSMLKAPCISLGICFPLGPEMTWDHAQEMTLDEYEKLMEEKNANLNKAPPKKSAKANMKEFEGMTAYTRKVISRSPRASQNGWPAICLGPVRGSSCITERNFGLHPRS